MPVVMEPGDACTDMDSQCTDLQVQLVQAWDLNHYKVDPYILETEQTQHQVMVQDHLLVWNQHCIKCPLLYPLLH